jgi:hypothetical protein
MKIGRSCDKDGGKENAKRSQITKPNGQRGVGKLKVSWINSVENDL